MLRKLRDLVVAGVAGGILVLAGTALADIPDTQPSAPDPAHTLYFCIQQGSAISTAYPFDRSLSIAQGKPDCKAWLGPGWSTVPVAPAVPSTIP